MAELPLLKLVEVLGVVAAGGAFIWWQLRDVNRAQEASRREREARAARQAAEDGQTPHAAHSLEQQANDAPQPREVPP
ncbi:MAG: hypothetical protein ACKOD9_15665, partial [Rubrivivax sp.]